jgi:hypothetical protein
MVVMGSISQPKLMAKPSIRKMGAPSLSVSNRQPRFSGDIGNAIGGG